MAQQPPILKNYPLAQVRQTNNGVLTYCIVLYWLDEEGRIRRGGDDGKNTTPTLGTGGIAGSVGREIKAIAILERVESIHVAANCFRKGYVTTCTVLSLEEQERKKRAITEGRRRVLGSGTGGLVHALSAKRGEEEEGEPMQSSVRESQWDCLFMERDRCP